MPSCPECEAALDVEEDEVEEGEVINCPDCGTELEVVHTHPIEVERLEDEEDEDDEGGKDDEEDEDEKDWK